LILLKELDSSTLDSLTDLLVKAFSKDPLVAYLFRGRNQTREVYRFYRLLLSVFSSKGSLYVDSSEANGLILWNDSIASPGFREWSRSGIVNVLGLSVQTVFRLFRVGLTVERAHKQTIKSRHLHLILLGVYPSSQGKGIGRRLLDILLEEANRLSLPCYLETQNEKNVQFYESAGFTVEKTLQISRSLKSWSMLRTPQ
jgi:ribosomal protein S18 acetylase RimI-like enzyme